MVVSVSALCPPQFTLPLVEGRGRQGHHGRPRRRRGHRNRGLCLLQQALPWGELLFKKLKRANKSHHDGSTSLNNQETELWHPSQ